MFVVSYCQQNDSLIRYKAREQVDRNDSNVLLIHEYVALVPLLFLGLLLSFFLCLLLVCPVYLNSTRTVLVTNWRLNTPADEKNVTFLQRGIALVLWFSG